MKTKVIPLLFLLLSAALYPKPAQPIPIPDAATIIAHLKSGTAQLDAVKKSWAAGDSAAAVSALLKFYRQKMSERYFFDWRNFKTRFAEYAENYPQAFERHQKMTHAHRSRYNPETHWRLPFTNLRGEQVTAYELRHLSRQQKSYDMALMYWRQDDSGDNLDYWLRQMADLNRAYAAGKVDLGGNAIYESFRAGKRVNNWLFVHNAYLASDHYSEKGQWLWLRTMLHHALEERRQTNKIRYGNHHTKGLVALFQLAVLFRDFDWADDWLQHAQKGLLWHVQKEISADGMQFERSTHYHMGDIYNYFRVAQLAQINHVEMPEMFRKKIRGLFEALVKLAHPDKTIPPLQDNTDIPYEAYNDISAVMKLGELLYEDPVYGWFTSAEIPAKVYWLLRKEQIEKNKKRRTQPPQIGSVALEESGYYVMRSGWQPDDLFLCISAGYEENKPSHQHADMLGLTAWANGHPVLPNYQVKYKEAIFKEFKNSRSKNVALLDNIPQGRGWKPNKGRTGYGSWNYLPRPQVTSWITTENYDYFAGKHNGFDTVGVAYSREVVFIKDGFWIVVDHFASDKAHDYQQVWQGAFSAQGKSDRLRKTYADGSGCDLIWPQNPVRKISYGAIGETKHTVVATQQNGNYSWLSVILPFKKSGVTNKLPGGWQILKQSDGAVKFENRSGDTLVLLTTRPLGNLELARPGTVWLATQNGRETARLLGPSSNTIRRVNGVSMDGQTLQTGDQLTAGSTLIIQ